MKLVWVSLINSPMMCLSLLAITFDIILYNVPTTLIGLNSSTFTRLGTLGIIHTQFVFIVIGTSLEMKKVCTKLVISWPIVPNIFFMKPILNPSYPEALLESQLHTVCLISSDMELHLALLKYCVRKLKQVVLICNYLEKTS